MEEISPVGSCNSREERIVLWTLDAMHIPTALSCLLPILRHYIRSTIPFVSHFLRNHHPFTSPSTLVLKQLDDGFYYVGRLVAELGNRTHVHLTPSSNAPGIPNPAYNRSKCIAIYIPSPWPSNFSPRSKSPPQTRCRRLHHCRGSNSEYVRQWRY
jgi:hypothetical protein